MTSPAPRTQGGESVWLWPHLMMTELPIPFLHYTSSFQSDQDSQFPSIPSLLCGTHHIFPSHTETLKVVSAGALSSVPGVLSRVWEPDCGSAHQQWQAGRFESSFSQPPIGLLTSMCPSHWLSLFTFPGSAFFFSQWEASCGWCGPMRGLGTPRVWPQDFSSLNVTGQLTAHPTLRQKLLWPRLLVSVKYFALERYLSYLSCGGIRN